jgi:ketosteroid isomerase-like protein
MKMPLAPKAYFDADTSRDADALVEAFAADAIVRDEGAAHKGHDAIRTWWTEAKAKYDHVAEPFEAEEDGDVVTVRAKVSGRFPNSPATLKYDFRIIAGKIAELKIG